MIVGIILGVLVLLCGVAAVCLVVHPCKAEDEAPRASTNQM